jgi:transcription antitermination factor NusA-like protein
MIPREIVKSQDRIKALLKEVKSATETQRSPKEPSGSCFMFPGARCR